MSHTALRMNGMATELQEFIATKISHSVTQLFLTNKRA